MSTDTFDRLPGTYGACRDRFLDAARRARAVVDSHPLTARGPDGEPLAIDVARLGPDDARGLLFVLSGVHGVEGFIGSALQTDFVRRRATTLPADTAVLLVHVVNPWGMVWSRRQNEHNVDLNRNWGRDDGRPDHNLAYDEVHAVACPAGPTMPSVADLIAATGGLVAARGEAWLRDAITAGQFRHPDGLHYGGERVEESTAIVRSVAAAQVRRRERVLVVDLHTGHGPPGAVTLLSDQPEGSDQDRYLRGAFPGWAVEPTIDDPSGATGAKRGQIAAGIRAMVDGEAHATTVEFGTTDDLAQIAATYRSHWAHFHGDRSNPEHAAAIREYRACFTPDDPAWETGAMTDGRAVLERALLAVAPTDER